MKIITVPITLLFTVFSISSAAEVLFHGSATLTSDYVIRGLSQTNDNPSLQLSTGAELTGSGVYGGIWIANVDTSELIPDLGQQSGIEVDYFIGLSRPLTRRWWWDINVGRYQYLNDERMLDYDYTEVSASLSYRNIVRLSSIYSPKATDHTRENALLQGERWSWEVSGELPLNQHFSLHAGLGYNDISQVSDVKHRYWNTGLTLRVNPFALNLAYIGTDSDARKRFIDGRADNRWVVSLVSVLGR